MASETRMHQEILEIPAAVSNLLTYGQQEMQNAVALIEACDPVLMTTIARGSSDHAATYFKYVCEIETGLPVASIGPSIASIYGCTLKLNKCVSLCISQSGKSPDIVRAARMAGEQGGRTIALTNEPESDLAAVCDHVLNLHAGSESSVAATKTFVNSIIATLWLVAHLRNDEELLSAIRKLPEELALAIAIDWSEFKNALKGQQSLFCIGRGPAFAISNEAALKFKETCQIHAESYSAAEMLHGPVSIVSEQFPVLALVTTDEAEESMATVADQMAAKGAHVFITSSKARKANQLPVVRTAHPLTGSIALVASLYAMIEQVAVERGLSPDEPRHLKKVTETV